MADKSDTGSCKPDSILLPESCVPSVVFSNPSLAINNNFHNTEPKAYNLMTNSTCTLTRKMYSGSYGVRTSTRSSMFPISSLQSNMFGESAFKAIQSKGNYNSSFSNNTNVIFGIANTVTTSAAGVSSVVGKMKTEMSKIDKSVHIAPKSEEPAVPQSDGLPSSSSDVGKKPTESFKEPDDGFQKPAIPLNPKSRGDNISTESSPIGLTPCKIKLVPTVHEELPMKPSLGYTSIVNRAPICSILGGTKGTTQNIPELSPYSSLMQLGGFAQSRPTISMSYSISGVFVNYDHQNVCITSASTTPLDGKEIPKPTVQRTLTSSTETSRASGGISSVLSPSTVQKLRPANESEQNQQEQPQTHPTIHDQKQNQEQTQDEQSQSSDSMETDSQIQSCSEPQTNKRKSDVAFSATEENNQDAKRVAMMQPKQSSVDNETDNLKRKHDQIE